jgi:uncharacterized membrane protein YhiD involved in acid resistance
MNFNELFNSVLTTTESTAAIDITSFLLCAAVSLVLGFVAAGIYMFKNNYNKGFVMTLALLPVVVQLVIMLVNGNLGAGLAVMGAFALVRFRSIPGSSKDIAAVFLSMAIGLATGMGFLTIAAIFTVIVGAATIIYTLVPFGEPREGLQMLKITIPETLDYDGVFASVLDKFTAKHRLLAVKTTSMGSLYRLSYEVTLKSGVRQKDFIDELRTRNGNLEIALGRSAPSIGEL